MLQEFCKGLDTPDDNDPFPELGFVPNLERFTGQLLNLNSEYADLYTVKKSCV